MAEYKVGIGSSIDRERNIRHALTSLRLRFGNLACSPVYEAEAVGFEGDAFLNLVARFETAAGIPEVLAYLKALEAESGRTGAESKFSGRTLDIDLLTVDDLTGWHHGVELPRGEILENAYVLQPLADLAGGEEHPLTGLSYAEHWRRFQGPRGLHRVAFDLPSA